MRFVWFTDPHLNHVPDVTRERWLGRIAAESCDAILVSGDIAESKEVVHHLCKLANQVETPVYFVLGNHDFYGGSIAATRQAVIQACRDNRLLNYLTDSSPVQLADCDPQNPAYLVGEDGWGDATTGDFDRSYVRLNDFVEIEDFRQSNPTTWKNMLGELGEASAGRLFEKLLALPEAATQIIILTHVPPFREACWYEGRTTDDNWAPFFVCGQVGIAIQQISRSRPHCRYTVLCGHTHHRGVAKLAPNLTVYTGAAHSGEPGIEAILDVTNDSILIRNDPRPDASKVE